MPTELTEADAFQETDPDAPIPYTLTPKALAFLAELDERGE